MARIKFGSIVTEGRGSLGGHTFQNSSGGVQLRTKPINNKKPSSAQSLIRSYNPHLQAGWRSLTDAQRDIWSRFATSHQICMLRDPDRPVCGHSLYMKYNFEYISRGLSLIASPYLMGPPYIGPNIIKNGTFDSEDLWIWQSVWSLIDNKAYYNAVSEGGIYQNYAYTTGDQYLLSFDISGCSGTNSMYLKGHGFTFIFAAPYNVLLHFHNGHYDLTVTIAFNSLYLRFCAYVTGSDFSLDNVSMRKLYS